MKDLFEKLNESKKDLEMIFSKYSKLSEKSENEISKIEIEIEFLDSLTKEEEEMYLKLKM